MFEKKRLLNSKQIKIINVAIAQIYSDLVSENQQLRHEIGHLKTKIKLMENAKNG